MTKTMKLLFMMMSIILFVGCSNAYKNEVMKEEFRADLNASNNPILKKPAIEIIEVSAGNFNVDSLRIPDMETIKNVKISGAQLNDVISLLTEATDQDIIFQLQSDTISQSSALNSNTNNLATNTVGAAGAVGATGAGVYGSATGALGGYENNDEYQIRQSKVYVSASNIGFGRLLEKAVGDKLSIRYDDKTYYLGYVKTVTLKIPSLAGLADELKQTLNTLGALNVVHDTITSSITFSAREKEYKDIMEYLIILRNNLYVIEYDIAIYNVELKDNYSLGINWNLLANNNHGLSLVSNTSSAFSTAGASATTATFGALFNYDDLTGSMIAEALTQFGKVESIQRPKLLGMAGTDVTLIDGLEEPYIKELSTTAVGDSGVQTSTVSATALSGLRVTLNSNILDGTVLTDISLEINDIVGYSNFVVNDVTYSQPRTHTKNIKNSMRVQPGVPIVISGLFRNQSDKGYKGIPGLAKTGARLFGGSEYEATAKTEMVIIVTPRVIKYVMK